MPTITLIGLGPGDPMLLTRAAWGLLQQVDTIYTPVPTHPALAEFRTHVAPISLDGEYDAALAALRDHAHRTGNACCALDGTPADWPAQIALLAGQACELQIVPGMSLAHAFAAALAQPDSIPQVLTLDTLLVQPWHSLDTNTSEVAAWVETQGAGAYAPPLLPYPLQPEQAALVWGFAPSPDESDVLRLHNVLRLRYPPEHPMQLVRLNTMGQREHLHTIPLGELSAYAEMFHGRVALYLPPLAIAQQRRSISGLQWVAARLLGPGGCSWDVQQSHQDLRANLLEETHEVLEALDSGDMAELADELGDLLFQVVAHSEMARQVGHFELGDVLERVGSKLIRRHPHVFGSLDMQDADELLTNWEHIKAQELADKGRERASALDGIPAGLPALAACQKVGKKAARVGFDWPTLEIIWSKVHEEMAELVQAHQEYEQDRSAAHRAHLEEELGDTLYVVVQLARWLGLDAESALRQATGKFRRRFTYVEQAAQAQGRTVQDLSLDEAVALWNEAKR
jgi:tetrapyrrole methylase family protein/MazG family protein